MGDLIGVLKETMWEKGEFQKNRFHEINVVTVPLWVSQNQFRLKEICRMRMTLQLLTFRPVIAAIVDALYCIIESDQLWIALDISKKSLCSRDICLDYILALKLRYHNAFTGACWLQFPLPCIVRPACYNQISSCKISTVASPTCGRPWSRQSVRVENGMSIR